MTPSLCTYNSRIEGGRHRWLYIMSILNNRKATIKLSVKKIITNYDWSIPGFWIPCLGDRPDWWSHCKRFPRPQSPTFSLQPDKKNHMTVCEPHIIPFFSIYIDCIWSEVTKIFLFSIMELFQGYFSKIYRDSFTQNKFI